MPPTPRDERWLALCAEILTVGLPFCVFKSLTGCIALAASPAGYALIALGAIDLALNLINLVSLLVRRRRFGPFCVAELLLRRVHPEARLGLAVDVFFSFALVALVIGAGLIGRLPPRALALWNVAVVLNVLGAGTGRLLAALRDARTDAE